MHAICEIVIPPTDDVAESVKQIMGYFDEESGIYQWFDFYVIGGRFSGHKLTASLDPQRLDAFHAALKERRVTVSGLVCGKQELSPASQIPIVDALWREFFPGKGEKCLLFAHSNDQYGRNGIYGHDICAAKDVPEGLTCERLIIAGPHWDKEKGPNAIQPERMLATEFWNGVEHQKTKFDGKVKPALAETSPDWLVVTVDYHN